jgi:hypothetical protein
MGRDVTDEQRSRRPIFIATPLHQSLTWCTSAGPLDRGRSGQEST